MLRIPTTLLLLALVSSCGLAERIFTTNECEGDNCKAPVLLDNSKADREWFCYGREEGEAWQCQNEPAPEQIQSIQAATSKPARVATAISQPVIAPTPPPQPERVRLPVQQPFEAQILAAPADYYAVQLIALRDPEGVREYAGLNGIEAPQMVKIRNEDSDWYVLLLDMYPNRAEAESARQNWITAKTLRVQPWIRQLGPLQSAILAARN